MLKFEFSVQTREGLTVDGVAIMGRDRADAERKLHQMYRYCQILRCAVREPAPLRQPRRAPAISITGGAKRRPSVADSMPRLVLQMLQA